LEQEILRIQQLEKENQELRDALKFKDQYDEYDFIGSSILPRTRATGSRSSPSTAAARTASMWIHPSSPLMAWWGGFQDRPSFVQGYLSH
jgi:hypothetical protein